VVSETVEASVTAPKAAQRSSSSRRLSFMPSPGSIEMDYSVIFRYLQTKIATPAKVREMAGTLL